ncbi:MAG: outer membrane protein assembly factor BamD [Bacteroidota bacterium]
MKKLVYIFLVTILFVSCSEYQKVLNKGTNADRYKMAEDLYKNGDYKKAIPLFEKLAGPYSGKPQMERIQYMTADSYYNTKDYSLSSYYFSKFITNYPTSSKVEEAAYLSSHSYYMAAPKYSLDQKDTYKALEAYQNFINTYPQSDKVEEANKYYTELSKRLEKKDFEVARQYYHTEYYAAAITAFNIFNEEHLGSVYKEDATYYKFKSAYELGMKSVLSKKQERLENAKTEFDKFKKLYPESDKLKEMNVLVSNIDKEILKSKESISLIESSN